MSRRLHSIPLRGRRLCLRARRQRAEANEEDEEAQQPMNFSLLDALEAAERKPVSVLVFARSLRQLSAFR